MIVFVIIRRIIDGHHGILHQLAAPACTTRELSREHSVHPHQLRVGHSQLDSEILIDAGLPKHRLSLVAAPQIVVGQFESKRKIILLIFERD